MGSVASTKHNTGSRRAAARVIGYSAPHTESEWHFLDCHRLMMYSTCPYPLRRRAKEPALAPTCLNKLNDSVWDSCLAELPEILGDVTGLQPDADSCIQGVGSQFVLMHVGWSAHWFCNSHQEVLSIFVNWREGF